MCVTFGRVLFPSMAGHPLSGLKFRGGSVISAPLIGILPVLGVVLLNPRFSILNEVGLDDTYGGAIISLLSTAAGVLITKQLFDSTPEPIEEAARTDGAGNFRRFWSVVLPMATPALVTIFILSLQGSWNEFGHLMVSCQSQDLNTPTFGVAQRVSSTIGSRIQFPLQFASPVLKSIPVAALFLHVLAPHH